MLSINKKIGSKCYVGVAKNGKGELQLHIGGDNNEWRAPPYGAVVKTNKQARELIEFIERFILENQ